ncbi:5-methylcytosine-specific restriction endonuclease McrA [Planctomycetales bacterium 10988]|nr:5-methylcytosine-specific restriction endonuclease McrA [Planctomycetales bacterium 10988]
MTSAVLERPTLVLNRNWQPVGVATVVRSLVKVWNGTAHVVDPHDFQLYDWTDWSQLKPSQEEPVIRTGRLALRVPEVVVLKRYDRMPIRVVSFSRRNVFKRDRYTCQYCGCRPGSEELTVDHVIPKAQGGKTTWENCVLACVACNNRKGGRTPAQAHMPLRKTPTQPRWSPLFAAAKVRIDSWSRFLSEAYWNTELQD